MLTETVEGREDGYKMNASLTFDDGLFRALVYFP
jgi:hypothetical protein